MKEKILNLLEDMSSDSKSASYEAEKKLCKILNEVIDKLYAVEKKVGWYVRDYPDKIRSVEGYGWYHDLPKEIECNDGDFCFETEWLDINLQEYFEELKKGKITSVSHIIKGEEYSLNKHKEDLKRIEELKFEDLNI